MATVWHHGVPWLDRAYDAASRRGLAPAVAEAALALREDRSCTTVPAGPGRVRVRVPGGETAAIVGEPGHVVLGFTVEGPIEASSRPDVGLKPAKRARGRGPVLRGPRDVTELVAWLAEAGYTVEAGRHQAVLDPAGRRVATLATSASDHRSLANVVSDIRRVTGLPLRKGSK